MKKIILALCSIVFFCRYCTAQIQDSPISFKTEVTGDFIGNIDGGKKRGYSYVGKIDLSATLVTDNLGWYKGGKLLIRAINAHGGNPSFRYIGDIQPVSRIEASNRISLFEFWYSQEFGKLSMLFGQFDMNSSFAVNKPATNFLNTSFGMYPSISLNVPLSIYPAASAAFFSKWKQSEKLSIQAAVFDGAPLAFDKNPNNIEWAINPRKGLFSTLEIQLGEGKEGKTIGNYKIGGYYHNGSFRDLRDTATSIKGNYGMYLSADRMLFSENKMDEQGLSGFFQVGSSPGPSNLVDFYLSSGVIYKGLIPNRNNDILGLGFVHSSINNKLVQLNPLFYSKSRSLFELNYKAKFGNNFHLQPDLQYIFNPGADPLSKNCLVMILRGAINY